MAQRYAKILSTQTQQARLCVKFVIWKELRLCYKFSEKENARAEAQAHFLEKMKIRGVSGAFQPVHSWLQLLLACLQFHRS